MWCPYVPKKLKCIIFAFVTIFGRCSVLSPIMQKYAPILPWLKFKHGHPWKTIHYDNIFGPLVVCFHPIMGTNCMILSKFHTDSYALFWTNVVIANFVMVNEWNFFKRIPQYSPLAMANWGGPLHEAFGNDTIHVVQRVESCGKFGNKGKCDEIPPIDNNIPSRILHVGWNA